MTTKNKSAMVLTVSDVVDVEEVAAPESTVALGQWYWLVRQSHDSDGERRTEYDSHFRDFVPIPDRELVCVMSLGSNYACVQSLSGHDWRVHFDDFSEKLTLEPNADSVWRQVAAAHQAAIASVMREIDQLTAALGLDPSSQLGESRNETAALVRVDGSIGADEHKAALAQAKEDLPQLFEQLEREHKQLARTMAAPTLPLKAQAGDLSALTEAIDARVLNIDLYAGLSEDIVQLRGGDPASYTERLAVRQRMLYMDEECLPLYRAGGMRFARLSDFDRWLCRSKKRWQMFLPEPRCVVAFRVRRNAREYDGPNDVQSFIQFWHESKKDERTYLYVRNGDQIYRLSTDFDFGERLFPDSQARSLDEELMIGDHGRRAIPRREYEERQAAYEAWQKANPRGDYWRYHDRDFTRTDWEPYTPDSIYFDDATNEIRKTITHYNRVAIILQGLFDRSSCLHPHPPVKTWTPEGFDQAVRLIYDNDHAIAPPDRPDFMAYWAEVNASLGEGSVTYGQRAAWREQLDDKYGGWKHVPYKLSAPGPGVIARVYKHHPRSGHVTYRWARDTNRWDRSIHSWKVVAQQVKLPISKVFNLDGYTPGDFRRFFDDPRTRMEYRRWAPYLLTAEDYHAGKLKIDEPYRG